MDCIESGKGELEELSTEVAEVLPRRRLLATVTVLGLPLVGVTDVAVNADTGGPGWLISVAP